MRKVIIFSTAYLPLIGGAELAVKEITNRINDCDFDLICARLDSRLPKTEKISRVNVYRIGFGSRADKALLPLLGFLKARRLCQKHLSQTPTNHLSPPPNHLSLILWGIMASWGSAAAWVFKLFYPRTPFLLTLQEGDAEAYIERGRLGLINLGWRLILKKADYIQVISNYLAEMARKYGYSGKIEIIPNGVSLKMYNVSCIKYNGEKIKSRLGIGSNEKVIITVSRLVEKNGIGDLIEAVSRLQLTDYRLPLKLLVLGSGPLEQNLKLKTKNLKLIDKILFLGEVPNEELPKYLAVSDVFVRASLSEGLGTAFLEAMAAGVPVIATSVGGIPDFLKDGETGLFCEVRNPESVAEKTKILLENDDLRNKIISNARKMVEEKYDWDKIAGKMEDVFQKFT